jgi:methionyl-tRNA formyltransferase
MSEQDTYLVVATKSWNRQIYEEVICRYPGNWHFIGDKRELTLEGLENLRPRMIFFLHWSWLVPAAIVDRYECVCFHMTDLPYGRGGSPLQNLIARGHKTTQLTALRMVEELDAGPVYLKMALDLSGSAAEIFFRASSLAAQMIETLIREQPQPRPQVGEVTSFPRRKPEQSRIPAGADLEQLYDQIRMLDAEGYPQAFLDHQGHRYRFSRARRSAAGLVAEVLITPLEEEKP